MAIDTIGTNAIANDAVTAAKIPAGAVDADITTIPDGSVTTAKIANDAVTTAKLFTDNLGRRNLIINGDMRVAQRGTSTTGMQNTGAIFTCDRFSHRRGGTWTNLQIKHEQVDVTDTLPLSVGLRKALKVTCTTAEGSVPSGSVSSGESVAIGHYLEKGDTHRLGVGSSSMSVSTLSFYVKASIATTYGIAIGADQHTNSHRIQIPFTVSSANTYQRISVNIPAYNIALDNGTDNTNGWNMHIVLDGVASAKTASTWVSNSSSAEQVVIMPNGVSTTGFSNTQNATFEITGVQLERGSSVTDFEHLPIGESLALCQRYFTKSGDIGTTEEWYPGVATYADYGNFLAMGIDGNNDRPIPNANFPVTMRGRPAIVYYPGRSGVTNTAGNITIYNGNTAVTTSSKPGGAVTGLAGYFQGTSTDSSAYSYHYTADAEM